MGEKPPSENRRHQDWSSFDDDLTDYILKKLPFADLLRCSDVCRSWRSIAHTHISSSPTNSPVLVLPKHYLPDELCPDEEDAFSVFEDSPGAARLICFFNPVTNELYKISHKSRNLLKGTYFVGSSSNGWALFRKEMVELVMFNPSIDVFIRIPCSISDSIMIKKALLLGDPFLDRNSTNNGIVGWRDILYVAAFGSSSLSFAICGDRRFRDVLGNNLLHPNDILHFNGLVYVVLNKGFIQVWDFNQMGCTPPTMVENYQPSFNPGKELKNHGDLCLMDWCGELWLVSRLGLGLSSLFRVFKLDFKERKWVDIDSLGDLRRLGVVRGTVFILKAGLHHQVVVVACMFTTWMMVPWQRVVVFEVSSKRLP